MAKLLISNKAIADMDEIWDYTVKTWSEEQADKYYAQIHAAISELPSLPDYLCRNFDSVKPGLCGFNVGHHVIFFHKDDEEFVWVDRILHERMDYTRHI